MSVLVFEKAVLLCLLAKGVGDRNRGNAMFQDLPSHAANRNVAGSSSQSVGNRQGTSSHQRSGSTRGSRVSTRHQQDGGQVIDIENGDPEDMGDSYKNMAAPMATKRSVRYTQIFFEINFKLGTFYFALT